MKTSAAQRYRIYSGIRTVARITSVISLLLLLFFLSDGFSPSKIENRQLIGLLLFPIGVVAGFVVAWKWETAGGFISLLSLLCFYIVYGVILSGKIPAGPWFLVFTLPAVIFLVSGFYGRIAIAEQYAGGNQPAESEIERQT